MDSDLVTINNQLNFEIRCIDTKMKRLKLKYKLEKDRNTKLLEDLQKLKETQEHDKYTHQKQLNLLSDRQKDLFNFRSTYFLFSFIIILIIYFFTHTS